MRGVFNITLPKSDFIGVLSSGLCMIHCIATPFFFVAATCSATCCSTAPEWWRWIDYTFLIISFVAVYHSTKSSNSQFIKYALWMSWVGLFLFLLNARFEWFYLFENAKFIPAFSLIGFHLYNLKYCQCDSNECC
ncbi:MAG: hypothetical protein CMG24_06410 [Candidatus Marinimicrobia bacterium]|nr:hypothetical protein [Candidatus Neomarinimicrobiota bacterium]|tara:strand:+ start:413 stop:817 length:405 start_codon:yes stop_codon:yes gene_type:complete